MFPAEIHCKTVFGRAGRKDRKKYLILLKIHKIPEKEMNAPGPQCG